MNTKLNLIPALAICLIAGPLHAAHAAQQPAQDDRTIRQVVRFGDLDLSTPAGKKALHDRLRAASWQVCREAVPPNPGLYIENAKCRGAVLQDAMTKVFGAGGKLAQLLARDQMVVTAARRAP
jgi:UrcA family protein